MTYHESVEIYGLLNSHGQKYWEMKLEVIIRRKVEKNNYHLQLYSSSKRHLLLKII
jgi:hypothetical protein